MKTVYCDVVFAANFFSDFALLYFCAEFLHFKPSKFKIFISSVLGGIFAVFCAIFINRVFTRFSLTLVFAPLMCMISFGKAKKERLIKICVIFILFSMFLGGFVFTVASIFTYNISGGGISLWIILIGITVSVITYMFAGNILSAAHRMNTADIVVMCCEKKLTFRLMCDSGNLLTDPYCGLPVIILSNDFSENFDFFKCKTRYIPIKTAQGNGIIKAIKPEKLELITENGKNIPLSAIIGFSNNSDADYGGFDGIIPCCLLDNI